jgi:DNA uptake protein ComE-like DNA-binding protein
MSSPHAPSAPPADLLRRTGILLLIVAVIISVWQAWPRRTPAQPPTPPADIRLQLDPNIATKRELTLIPGIGPTRAAGIVAARAQHRFSEPADLAVVRTFGPATIEKVAPYLRFDATAEAEKEPAP